MDHKYSYTTKFTQFLE